MLIRLACLAAVLQPLAARPAAADVFAGEQSTLPTSSVTVHAEPLLSDGRLVIKLAAKNASGQTVAFGPSILVLASNGTPIAWRPLRALIADVEAAYGMEQPVEVAGSPDGSTAVNTPAQRGFQPDVSNYTGSSAVAQTEAINSRSRRPKRKKVSAADKAKAEAEIAQLNQAILQDRMLAAGQVAAGMLVTEKLKPSVTGQPLTLTITIGPDRHSFNFRAPASQ